MIKNLPTAMQMAAASTAIEMAGGGGPLNKYKFFTQVERQRPYHIENTASCPISDVK